MNLTRQFEELIMTESEREAFLARVRAALSPEDYRKIEGKSHALSEIVRLIEQDPMTLRKLRHILFGPKTEKTDRVCPPATPAALAPDAPKPKRQGHGRAKAKDYTGARWVQIGHPDLKAGDRCPLCPKGNLRAQQSPAIILRIVGSPPISATGYQMERLRCDTCGAVFTAPAPPEAGTEKYDPSVGVTVAFLRYGSGMPHYRLARLQKSLGVPLPESTQRELHAGENLAEVLRRRAADLDPPIQMYDALSRSRSPELQTILAHCLSHGRREFVSVAESFPNECRHVLEVLGEVYHVDAQTKELGKNPEQRLLHHQTHSQPVMARLQAWLQEQRDGKKVEPNSGLVQAVACLLKHWEPLTLFFRKAGAPLDNNRCEQALKTCRPAGRWPSCTAIILRFGLSRGGQSRSCRRTAFSVHPPRSARSNTENNSSLCFQPESGRSGAVWFIRLVGGP